MRDRRASDGLSSGDRGCPSSRCRSSPWTGRFVAVPGTEYKVGDGGPSHASVESSGPGRNPGLRVRRRPRGGSRGALPRRTPERSAPCGSTTIFRSLTWVSRRTIPARGIEDKVRYVMKQLGARPGYQGDVVRLHQHERPRNHASRPGAGRAAAGSHARIAGAARKGPLEAGTRGAGRGQTGGGRRRGYGEVSRHLAQRDVRGHADQRRPGWRLRTDGTADSQRAEADGRARDCRQQPQLRAAPGADQCGQRQAAGAVGAAGRRGRQVRAGRAA